MDEWWVVDGWMGGWAAAKKEIFRHLVRTISWAWRRVEHKGLIFTINLFTRCHWPVLCWVCFGKGTVNVNSMRHAHAFRTCLSVRKWRRAIPQCSLAMAGEERG
jgi:hypothetical protein